MRLTDEQIAEVVEFDRRRREAYRRRNGKKQPRTTERYNYIVPVNRAVPGAARDRNTTRRTNNEETFDRLWITGERKINLAQEDCRRTRCPGDGGTEHPQ